MSDDVGTSPTLQRLERLATQERNRIARRNRSGDSPRTGRAALVHRIERAALAIQSGFLHVRAIVLHHSLVRVFLGAGGVMVVAAWIVELAERHVAGSNIHSFGTSLWWAIVTVTTVGYGDHFPISETGRIVAVVMMMIGIGLIGTLTATVASAFVRNHAESVAKDIAERAQTHHVALKNLLEGMHVRLGDVERRLGASDDELSALDRQADAIAETETLEE